MLAFLWYPISNFYIVFLPTMNSSKKTIVAFLLYSLACINAYLIKLFSLSVPDARFDIVVQRLYDSCKFSLRILDTVGRDRLLYLLHFSIIISFILESVRFPCISSCMLLIIILDSSFSSLFFLVQFDGRLE